ncbi:MAG: Abortive infection phage resistance protein [Edaphobacter sp.]|nr:Abortive infection phage resistance protein [Edaphobacter sp.]
MLVDSITQERLAAELPSNKLDEVFEFFAFEQVLKDFDLSREEIEVGWVDGRNDGGIDGFYTFVNGHLLQDPNGFVWPKRNAEIEVHILTCKHHDTFQQATLNALIASVTELFDLSNDLEYLGERYATDLLEARGLLIEAYKHLSIVRPKLKFRFSYVSRGDSSIVGENIQSRADQICGIVQDLFSHCEISFTFVGAAELIALYRKTKSFSLDLNATELMTTGPGSYLAIARLDDYKNFVTDEEGSLRRYLFDSNVRDYLGENRVNEDIGLSLADPNAPEFWWLNNGITVLATGASAAGKILSLQDIQIVNGLQTTESIFRHFQTGTETSSSRGVLVKVVVSSDAAVRDRIIRATNNQSLVRAASLHATDKLQRDIEEVLERHDWYYERRKNYYRNIGKPSARFVTPLYIAAGYIALVMKNPAFATRLRSRFMRTQQGYESVFSASAPLGVWVSITEILKRVEATLSEVRPVRASEGERFLSSWRNLVALLVVAKIMGTFAITAESLRKLDIEAVTKTLILEMWNIISAQRKESSKQLEFRSALFIKACCETVESKYGVTSIDIVGRQRPHTTPQDGGGSVHVTPEFVALVDSRLPDQPWKPGLHLRLMSQLNCTNKEITAAINNLIERGIRLQQKNGIVYDSSGKVVAVDASRQNA